MMLAVCNKFIQDDGFIYFRYAQNFAEGKGLIWNPGEIIDGFSNVLWIFLLSIGFKFGFEPIIYSQILGIIFFGFTLLYLYKSTSLINDDVLLNLLILLVFGSNYTVSAFATGGVDTHMQTSIITAAMYCLLKAGLSDDFSYKNLLTLSIVLGFAFVVRMDSAIIIVIILPTVLFLLFKNKQKPSKFISIVIPSAIIANVFLSARLHYFGDIFPNVFYAKANVKTYLDMGIRYLCAFYKSYHLYLLLIAIIFLLVRYLLKNRSHLKKEIIFPLITAGLVFILWHIYIIKINGDYMEFRIMVPCLPFLMIVSSSLFKTIDRGKIAVVLMLILLTANNFIVAYNDHSEKSLAKFDETGYMPISSLNFYLYDHGFNWIDIGKTLGKKFQYRQDIILATIPAGAIPFYSKLFTIDLLGLNDKWIAHNGPIVKPRIPGHSKFASEEYILKRNTNLIIRLPIPAIREQFNETKQDAFKLWGYWEDGDLLPEDATFISFPINKDKIILLLYIKKHPFIEELIATNEVTTHSIFKKSK